MGTVQDEKPVEGAAAKPHVRELRNTELVSRLLAATPPYLYSALPLQPHAFFFSEMLRSFVNARHGCRPPHYHRRFKRRSHKYFAENEDWRRDWPKQDEKKDPEPRPEVPLELTVEKPRSGEQSPRLSPKAEPPKQSPSPPGRQSTFVDVGTEELPKPSPCIGRNSVEPNSVPSSNLILPPPPPMWYPPLYNPQFGVDPLNFFIDLRVSGHIYDRKRAEAMDVNINQEHRSGLDESNLEKRLGKDLGQKPRHLSAFSVPVRSSHGQTEGPEKYFERSNRFLGKPNGTSYIMRNLKCVYENLHSQERKEESKEQNEDTKGESSDIDDDIID
ncbi:uncharacterized protein LOC112046379 [Bicyclus anynana]|uniref:Uncharacterized protein LOC112046379 n=1 Tax=Bicyclus anynana TaxID=110368 RepID=A0A6J1N155_BICAN|nr:uncharacterized protein LOC112046379 [Bicyclus anynana]